MKLEFLNKKSKSLVCDKNGGYTQEGRFSTFAPGLTKEDWVCFVNNNPSKVVTGYSEPYIEIQIVNNLKRIII